MVKMNAKITFKTEQEDGDIINLSFVNDFIMHPVIHKVAANFINKSFSDSDERVASGFYHLFEKIAKYISCTDISFLNLETPLARHLTAKTSVDSKGRDITVCKNVPDEILYDEDINGFFRYNFNVHPALALALKKVGWNIVNMANNHVNDRLSNGIDLTIETLDSYGIDHVGSISYDEIIKSKTKDIWDFKPYIIKDVKGIRIAFFGVTQFVNPRWDRVIFKKDRCIQVYRIGRNTFFPSCNGKNIPRMIKWFEKAKNVDEADFIIVYLHWGFGLFEKMYGHSPDFLQRKWSKILFEGGADILIGGHTHTLQPAQKYKTKDGRETFVVYSLGNFLTDYIYDNQLASVILYITLVKNRRGRFIKKIKFLPTYSLSKREGKKFLDVQVVPIDKYKHLYYLFKHYDKILGKSNLISSNEIEKEFSLT